MIFLTGDTHGEFRRFGSKFFLEGRQLTKDDYVIILGDFGGLWLNNENDNTENYWLDWLDNKKFTTLFVCGNHENHTRLDNLPTITMFGKEVGKVRDSIFHLKRGEIYTIENNKFFVMGGAESIDKNRRQEHISWWKREIPNGTEMDYGLINLEANNNTVDYLLTHTAPSSIVDRVMSPLWKSDPWIGKFHDPTAKYLEFVYKNIGLKFKHWFFGHLHDNVTYEKFTCLYERIIKL